MDGDEFFDGLYGQFYIHFPCYAMLGEKGHLAAEPADDGTLSLVLLTDDDLAAEYAAGHAGRHLPVILADEGCLGRFLAGLPRGFTHVAFDPAPTFHRRYPLAAIRDRLAVA